VDRVVLVCHGVPAASGPEAALDITAEFAEHRPWQKQVRCTWDGKWLTLQADTENDPKGLGLMDEFSDCISAYIAAGFDGGITVQSVSPVVDNGVQPFFSRHRMATPRIYLVGVYIPTLDSERYCAFVDQEVSRQNPINFSDELKDFLKRVGREAEIVAMESEELEERREYFEQKFSGVAQVEVLVEDPGTGFSVGDFQQVNPDNPSPNWQVAWGEKFLTPDGSALIGEFEFNDLPVERSYRVVFFIHDWKQHLGLDSTYGPLTLVDPSPVPERLWQLAPYGLVD